MNETPWLLIPLRSLARGKRRLASVLDVQERIALNTLFLDHVLTEADQWPGLARTLVVSPSMDVLRRASAAGAKTLRQPGLSWLNERSSQTLNAALAIARRTLQNWGARNLMVVSCDLPALRSRDLRRLVDCGHDGVSGAARVVLASDRAGRGTNALYLPARSQVSPSTDLPFCFGADSARRHAEAALRLDLPFTRVDIPGLAFDIDTPDDLAMWLQTERVCA